MRFLTPRVYKHQAWVTFFCRLVVAGVVIAAGVIKAGNPSKSAMAVRAYELLPVSIANTWGYVLPWLEIGAGIFLLLGVAVRASAIFTSILFILFIFAVGQAWARGLNIDCGCFGGGGAVAPGKTQYLAEILRDIGLLLGSYYLVRFPFGKFGLDKDHKESSEDEL